VYHTAAGMSNWVWSISRIGEIIPENALMRDVPNMALIICDGVPVPYPWSPTAAWKASAA
jgi:hypothetical protein